METAKKKKEGKEINTPEIKAEIEAVSLAKRDIFSHKTGHYTASLVEKNLEKSNGDSALFTELMIKDHIEIQKRPGNLFVHSISFPSMTSQRKNKSAIEDAADIIQEYGNSEILEQLTGLKIKLCFSTYNGPLKSADKISLNLTSSPEQMAVELVSNAKRSENLKAGKDQENDVQETKYAFISQMTAQNNLLKKCFITDVQYQAFEKACKEGQPFGKAVQTACEARESDETLSVRQQITDMFQRNMSGDDIEKYGKKFENILKIMEMTQDGRDTLKEISKIQCAVVISNDIAGSNTAGTHLPAQNKIALRPYDSDGTMAHVLRHECEHALQLERRKENCGKLDIAPHLMYFNSIEASACAQEAAFCYDRIQYFPEIATFHPVIYKAYADEMENSGSRENAWGESFKAWEKEGLWKAYEQAHTHMITDQLYQASGATEKLSEEGIFQICHPNGKCPVEPEYLSSKEFLRLGQSARVQFLSTVMTLSIKNQTPPDMSAFKVHQDEKGFIPEYKQPVEEMERIIKQAYAAKSPVKIEDIQRINQVFTEMRTKIPMEYDQPPVPTAVPPPLPMNVALALKQKRDR